MLISLPGVVGYMVYLVLSTSIPGVVGATWYILCLVLQSLVLSALHGISCA